MEHWTDMEQIWGGSGLPVLVLAPEAEGCATVYGNAAAQEDAPTKVKECLGKIKIASNHMMSLLNEVLIVARPQTDAGKPKFHLEIGELVRESIWADGVRLKQICLNLLSNAIKYTPAGGAGRAIPLRRPGRPAGPGDDDGPGHRHRHRYEQRVPGPGIPAL